MNIRLLLISTFLLVCRISLAQEATTPTVGSLGQADTQIDSTKYVRYHSYNVGLSLPLLRDDAASLLRYSGPGVLLHSNTARVKPTVIKQINMRVGAALLGNQANGNSVSMFNSSIDYLYFRRMKTYRQNRLRLFAGGGGDMLLNLKLFALNVNNSLTYDYAASLKVAGHLEYDFKLFKRRFLVTEQLSVPFIAVLSRPVFSWPAPYDAYEEGGHLINAFRLASFGSYLRLQNRITLDWYPTERRRRKARHNIASNWRVAYEWDYLQIRKPSKTQLAIPAITLGRVVRF